MTGAENAVRTPLPNRSDVPFLHEADANARAVTKANTALREKQQLTILRLLVRGVGELAAVYTRPEQEIALTRWDALVTQFNTDPKPLHS